MADVAPKQAALRILSIQSWVAYGHVGNAAALFPLQRLGAEVLAVHTLQFSNHPGYGRFRGMRFPPSHVADVITGLAERGILAACNGVLSGYLAEAGTGAAVVKAVAALRIANPAGLYCCDPVFGDDDPGVYVHPDLPRFFLEEALPAADIATPNRFELAYLTGNPCRTLADVKAAMTALQRKMRSDGLRTVLVSSLNTESTPEDAIDTIVGESSAFYLLRTPKLPLRPSGSGDLLAALFFYHCLRGNSGREALENAVSALFGILRRTAELGQQELAIIAAQDEVITPSRRFRAEPV